MCRRLQRVSFGPQIFDVDHGHPGNIKLIQPFFIGQTHRSWVYQENCGNFIFFSGKAINLWFLEMCWFSSALVGQWPDDGKEIKKHNWFADLSTNAWSSNIRKEWVDHHRSRRTVIPPGPDFFALSELCYWQLSGNCCNREHLNSKLKHSAFFLEILSQ